MAPGTMTCDQPARNSQLEQFPLHWVSLVLLNMLLMILKPGLMAWFIGFLL
jgi:hypothetical protein